MSDSSRVQDLLVKLLSLLREDILDTCNWIDWDTEDPHFLPAEEIRVRWADRQDEIRNTKQALCAAGFDMPLCWARSSAAGILGEVEAALWKHGQHPTPPPPKPPLTDSESKVFEIIESDGPVQGVEICRRTGVSQSGLTSHIIPALKKKRDVKTLPSRGYHIDGQI